MHLNTNFLIILIITVCFWSCREDQQQLDIAKQVYNSNYSGIELFEALSDEHKKNLQEYLDGRPYANTPLLNKFLGKPTSQTLPKSNSKIHRITKYRISSDSLTLVNIPYPEVIKEKNICIKSVIEYNDKGLPTLFNSKSSNYQNGKLNINGNNRYRYSDNKTVISYKGSRGAEIEERYTMSGLSLSMNEYKNGNPTGTKRQVEYNKQNQRIKLLTTTGEFKNAYSNDIAIFEYDDYNRLTKFKVKFGSIIDGKSTSRDWSIKNYAYDLYGFLDTESGPENILGFKTNQKKYFYNFFLNQEGLLNTYKLICPPGNPKNGNLVHYIFDKHLNILFYHSYNFQRRRSYVYFNEYEYY